MPLKILIVLTSHDRLGDTGHKTGYWLEELAAPYLAFRDAGAEVTLASPNGGKPPRDPGSDGEEHQNDITRRFDADEQARAQLANTLKLADVRADDYDAIFYPGGHGPLWDLVSNDRSIQLIETFWTANKPVASVCHGPIVLVNAKDASGEYILRNRTVTGFTNSEEEAVGLTDVVPLSVEDMLIDRGGKFDKTDNFESHSLRDGNLITGQNPASSEGVAAKLLEALAERDNAAA